MRKQPGVKDCVVLPSEREGNAEPLAVLLMEATDEAAKSGAQEAVERGNALLAEYQRTRSWMIWPEDDFPRTTTGKPRIGEIANRLTRNSGPLEAKPGSGKLDQLLARFGSCRGSQQGLET